MSDKASQDDDSEDNDALLEWAREMGGYFNPKLSMGTDSDGLFGVLANAPIPKDEVLMRMPWRVVISSDAQRRHHNRFINCDTVQLLKEELDKGDSSRYAPYTAALKQRAKDHYHLLPAHWSKEGQDLLRQVLNDGHLPARDMFYEEFEWKKECDKVDPVATLLVLTHGENLGMSPVTDRFNNRAGEHIGAKYSIDGGRMGTAIEIKSSRYLKPGEHIYVSYRDYGWIGTPELFRDYGFVELYPQRYVFYKQRIAFDVLDPDDTKGDLGGQALKVKWREQVMQEEYIDISTRNGYRKRAAVRFLRQEHRRLKQIACPLIMKAKPDAFDSPSQHEIDMAAKFCHSMMIAMEAALLDLHIPIPISIPEDDTFTPDFQNASLETPDMLPERVFQIHLSLACCVALIFFRVMRHRSKYFKSLRRHRNE